MATSINGHKKMWASGLVMVLWNKCRNFRVENRQCAAGWARSKRGGRVLHKTVKQTPHSNFLVMIIFEYQVAKSNDEYIHIIRKNTVIMRIIMNIMIIMIIMNVVWWFLFISSFWASNSTSNVLTLVAIFVLFQNKSIRKKKFTPFFFVHPKF